MGSFRGKAELILVKEYKIIKKVENAFIDHPVDPLITNIIRGVMLNLLPYPIVDNATVDFGFEIKEGNFNKYISFPTVFKIEIEDPKIVKRTIII